MVISSSQRAALDWTRGLAAQLVLVGHIMTPDHARLAVMPQNLGVALFFLLSGFLIAGTTVGRGPGYRFRDYMIDRASRIYTAYLPALAFIVLCDWAFNLAPTASVREVIGNALMLQDYPLWEYLPAGFGVDRLGTGRPLWSVAVEWWIYMGFGALLFAGRRGLPAWSWGFAALGVLAIGLGAIKGSVVLLWLFAAALSQMHGRVRPTRLVAFAGAGLLLCAGGRLALVRFDFYDLPFGLLLGGSLFLFLQVLAAWRPPAWFQRGGAALAAFSYSLYLTHNTVLAMAPGWQAVLWANLAAIAVWFCFERHYRGIASWARSRLDGEAEPFTPRDLASQEARHR